MDFVTLFGQVRCPKCGDDVSTSIKVTPYGRIIVQLCFCDKEDGGCGNRFAIKGVLEFKVQTSSISFFDEDDE